MSKPDGIERLRLDLKLPLLIQRGSKGLLACGYIDVSTTNKTGEACAIVRGVGDFDDMLDAIVTDVSAAAEELGVRVGMTGRDALDRFR